MSRSRRARRHSELLPDGVVAGNLSSDGIALSPVGQCEMTVCRAPVFVELLMPGAPHLCVDCAPPFVERRERFRGLFERSGGRLPADFGRFLVHEYE